MAEVVVQHEVPHPQPLGAGQKEGGRRPGLEGVAIGLPRAVEVVVEPQGVQPGGFGGEGPFEEGVGTQGDLRQVQPDLDPPGAGGRSCRSGAAGLAQPAASLSAT